MVIFGASGDLAKRKLMPALWALNEAQQLPPGFSIIGVARSELSHEEFREQLRDSISHDHTVDQAMLNTFLQGLFYCSGAFDQPGVYEKLKRVLQQVDRERGTAGNRMYYLATPPSFFPVITHQLGDRKSVV